MNNKLENELKAALLTNWNTDTALTPIEADSEMFALYFRNTLISMVKDETAQEWIDYFARKQAKLNVVGQ